MAAWDELKAVLLRLRDEQPGVLMQYPMPEVDEGRVPPFAITLAPWATSTAEELHRQFGTASFTPELGYILPPGSWGIQVPLDLAPDIRTRHRRLTPVLPLTITA
jgi:hypothetical protein